MSAQLKHKSTDLDFYKTKKLLEVLRNKKGFHTELISLYIPHERKLSDVTNYLKNEIAESQNIKSKLTRKNVLDGISSLLGQLKNIKETPENGLILFAGAIPQNNAPGTEKNELYILHPPEKVQNFKYHCASEFLIEPLQDMIKPKDTYGLIVVGRKESAVGYIRGNRVEVVREFTSGIHGKHHAGGQSQRRFERVIEEGELRYYRRISEDISEIFLNIEGLKGIFVGGPGGSKEKFVEDEGLDYRLREKIMDTVDLGYSGSEGIRALVDKVKDKIENVKYIKEKKIMQRFLKEISNDSGLAIYGYEEVKKTLNFGAVDILILSERLDIFRIKQLCANCGYSNYKSAREQELKRVEADSSQESCPKCSSNNFKVVEKTTIIEELGNIAEGMGTDIEIISSETEEGESLYSTFGGIIAILRFKINY